MALYAIGDTHLSLNSNKSMEVFGIGWENYVERLKEGFSEVQENDTVVLCGDLSWGMSLQEAEKDFAFLDHELPLPLALFVVMLPKAHSPSHSRMSGSR